MALYIPATECDGLTRLFALGPPVVYVPGGAEYHGFYATVVVQQTILANESAATWNVYRCDVGTPFGRFLFSHAS